jgi:hypothetical protein
MMKTFTLTCGSCLQEWTDNHRCSIPPLIEWSRYTDGVLLLVAAELERILADREKWQP